MNRAFLIGAALLSACAGSPVNSSSAPAPGGPVIEVREAFTCPLPASRGLITITRDGKAERVIFEGLEFELGKTKSTREQMMLSGPDVTELFRLVTNSDWRTMPETPQEFSLHPQPAQPDACSGSLYIKTAEGGKSLSYTSDRKPAKLAALIKGVDDILARGSWTKVVYAWENQR